MINEGRPSSGGRYEFRCWLDDLSTFESKLQQQWPFIRQENRQDTYLLPAKRHDVLPKIRGGERLDFKVRICDVGALQYWTMPFAETFPISSQESETIAHFLGLRSCVPADALQNAPDFINALDPHHIQVVSMDKQRDLYVRDSTRMEVISAVARGRILKGVALEDRDKDAALATANEFELLRFSNEDYGATITTRFLDP